MQVLTNLYDWSFFEDFCPKANCAVRSTYTHSIKCYIQYRKHLILDRGNKDFYKNLMIQSETKFMRQYSP
jgi:hypothetical protein